MPSQDINEFIKICQQEIIKLALKEDVFEGDVTSLATIPLEWESVATLVSKDIGILSGVEAARLIIKTSEIPLELNVFMSDGEAVKPGDKILEMKGSTRQILTYERTILNFMQRMSGIATKTNRFVKEIEHTKAKIIDTRKTAPGLRYFDKQAVVHGGGSNHRSGLYDLILIKDNHIDACGGIKPAIQSAKNFIKQHNRALKIEIEVRSLNELKEVLEEGADIILLDNFELKDLLVGVEMVKQHQTIKTEASGGVELDTVKKIAESGVDYISVGALTHSVKALDLSLLILNPN